METSFSTTKREKITCKESDVIPSNYHLGDDRQFAAMVSLNGETHWSAWYDTEIEATKAKVFLEAALDYKSYPTMEEEGTGPEGVKAMAERVRIMNERYKKSGRDDPNHPMHSLFTGLAKEYEQVSDDNSE